MSGISSKAVAFGDPQNKKKFNGIEQNSDFDLNMYDAFYRNLDPQIGKWWQIDPLSDMLTDYSPYESMGNNPISNKDPLGDFKTKFGAQWHRFWHGGGGAVRENEYGEWFYTKTSINEIASTDATAPIMTVTRIYGPGRKWNSAAIDAIDNQMFLDQMVRDGTAERYETVQEANEATLKKSVGVLLPNFFFKPLSNITNTSKAPGVIEETTGAVNNIAKTPVGRSGNPIQILTKNVATTIGGRTFSGHALDQMQARGIISPTAVIDVINNPATRMPGNTPGTMVYIRDNLKVVTNSMGNVMTVMFQ